MRSTRFRWVTCQLEVIAKCSNLHKLRVALRTLPKTLDETYHRILSSIDEELRDDALKLLQWLAFSVRPLTLAEMAEIFAIDRSEHLPRFDPDQRPREPRGILDICSSLVTVSFLKMKPDMYGVTVPNSVHQSGTLSLAHLSVKEYLVSERIRRSSMSYYHLDQKLANTAISRECLAYLLQFDTANCLSHCTEASISFGRYAAQFWIVQAWADDGVIHDDAQPMIRNLFLSQSAHFSNWISLFDIDTGNSRIPGRSPETFARPLYYASLMGLDQVVDQLLLSSNVDDINLVGGRYGSALTSASANGHISIVQTLLDKGADVNFKLGGDHCGALACASSNGHEAVVRLLLDNGADVDLEVGPKGSALISASWEGHKQIVQILLEHGADINFVGPRGGALESASAKGHESIVRMLLESGADVGLTGGWGGALASASLMGKVAVVQLLLENGANVNGVGAKLANPLRAASGRGHLEIVRILLECGADMSLRSIDGDTALMCASDPEIIRLLLENGADATEMGGIYYQQEPSLDLSSI